MACASCARRKRKGGYTNPEAMDQPPMGANDVMVLDKGEVRKLNSNDWPEDRHKLILFFPETFTPVCQTELGALNNWVQAFNELGVDVYGATADPIHAVKDWYDEEEALANPQYKVLSSYILPTRLSIMNNGRVKRASVFITKDDEVIIQEHFMKVGRSIAELHRTFYAFTTDSYCGENWRDPSDGFLSHD